MALDPKLLAEALEAAQRVVTLQTALDGAKADYAGAVRRLHLAGGPLREIAAALDLSHQRVHQIIETSRQTRWDKRPAAGPPACSFCGSDTCDKIVSGPGVFICGVCVPAAAATAATERAIGAGTLVVVAKEHTRVRCSFCGKPRRHTRSMVGGRADQICNKCLTLCVEILAESEDP